MEKNPKQPLGMYKTLKKMVPTAYQLVQDCFKQSHWTGFYGKNSNWSQVNSSKGHKIISLLSDWLIMIG